MEGFLDLLLYILAFAGVVFAIVSVVKRQFTNALLSLLVTVIAVAVAVYLV